MGENVKVCHVGPTLDVEAKKINQNNNNKRKLKSHFLFCLKLKRVDILIIQLICICRVCLYSILPLVTVGLWLDMLIREQ